MQLYAVHLEKLNESIFNFILARLEFERSRRIRSFTNPQDARRSLLGDVLSRTLLCEQAGISWQDLKIRRSARGKPYAENTYLEYSVSHAGDWIVCAVDDRAVGVDIEKIRPIDLNVPKHFFTKREVEALFSRQPADQEAYFFELWTVKESCLKATGSGLYEGLDTFSAEIDDTKQVTVKGLLRYDLQVRLNQQFPGYKMAVCYCAGPVPNQVMVLSFKSLLNRFLTVLSAG